MKKVFPDNKNKKNGVKEFFEKRGFYIVLAMCILIIGVSAIYVAVDNLRGPEIGMNEKIIPEETPDKNTSIESSLNSASKLQASSLPIPSATPAITATPIVTASPVPLKKVFQKAELDQNLIMPVFGQISFEYADKNLVYSRTMEDWRTHNGVDIAADKGTLIKAAADGTVIETKNDPRFGATIVIDHGKGYKTVYSNLADTSMVSVNQIVKQGEGIGSVGLTASFESSEQAHLHFEVLENDNNVDPTKLLPKLN
jgi:murein DD-endopeptidase MepM/ murein hydrolase activator NlpD